MDPETIERLASEYPERWRGGRIDRDRPLGRVVSETQAWDRARRCLADDWPPGAAYWAGFAGAGHVVVTDLAEQPQT